MFIFQFMGGLGNQMFQYAAARALSVRRNIPFKVDFDDPYKFVKREFNLSMFDVQPMEHAGYFDLLKSKPKRRIQKRLWMLLGQNPNGRLYKEPADYMFDPGFFSCPDGSYISGFWQTEKYFLDIEDIIRKEFRFVIPPSAKNEEWLNKINSSTSVSVHVRRGDVVAVAKTNKLYGTMTNSFYEDAMNHMVESLGNCSFFFFSDDIEWVKENIKTSYPAYYIDNNDDAHNYEDLRLMSSCKHHIIANSSFSWWGAWLNPDKNKKVIGPAKWMSTRVIAETDHIPGSWILL